MSDTTIQVLHRIVQSYARKMVIMTLTEYEMLLYEQCCNTLNKFMKYWETSIDKLTYPQNTEMDQS